MNRKPVHNSPEIGAEMRPVFDYVVEHGPCPDEDIIAEFDGVLAGRTVAILSELRAMDLININDSYDRSIRTIRLTPAGTMLARALHRR